MKKILVSFICFLSFGYIHALSQIELAKHIALQAQKDGFIKKINNLKRDESGHILISHNDLKDIANYFINTISQHVYQIVHEKEQPIVLPKLGIFYPKRIREHTRKLKNGKNLFIPEKRAIGFKKID